MVQSPPYEAAGTWTTEIRAGIEALISVPCWAGKKHFPGLLQPLFTGSDVYGAKEVRRCCILTEDDHGPEATLDLPTFSATAEMAARSRAMGGYHIPIDNDVGLRVGRDIAKWSWPKYQAYFDGTASVRP